jgi:anthranilate synthase component 1
MFTISPCRAVTFGLVRSQRLSATPSIECLLDGVESSEIGGLLLVNRGQQRVLLYAVDPQSSVVVRGPRHHWDKVSGDLRGLVRGTRLVLGYSAFSALRFWEKVPYRSPEPFNDLEYYGFDHFLLAVNNDAWSVGEPRVPSVSCEASSCIQGEEEADAKLVFEKPGVDGYVAAVRKAKKHIAMGEIFQVVVARKLGITYRGSFKQVFIRLLKRNPSPYMYYFKMGDRRIIGCSPETLVRLDGQRVETYPIAGTRSVTGKPAADKRLRKQLLMSRKDAAEHVMLVDLARNDIGRVCRVGTVRVPWFRKVYGYSHVQHLVSKVVGQVDPKNDCLDVFKAVFPAGTVSGAPKLRAIELIDAFEREPRGPYAGSVGYFMGPQRMDLAINIRSLYAVGNLCFVQAGAGIVAASRPLSEYRETESKARVLLDAMSVKRGVESGD